MVNASHPLSARIEPGDAFVQAGSPGHAVIVLDVVASATPGERRFLLVQDAHVLRHPGSSGGPRYPERFGERLVTAGWMFDAGDRRRP